MQPLSMLLFYLPAATWVSRNKETPRSRKLVSFNVHDGLLLKLFLSLFIYIVSGKSGKYKGCFILHLWLTLSGRKFLKCRLRISIF